MLEEYPNLGPGTYNAGKQFGEDLGHMTIGVKRTEKEKASIGPGVYDPSEKHTRPKGREVDFTQ